MDKIHADELYKNGINILNKIIYFGDKKTDATECFKKSINIYKILKEHKLVIKCYQKLILCSDTDDIYEIAGYYKNIAEYYVKLEDNKLAIDNYKISLDKYLTIGKYKYAAEIADIIGDIENDVKWLDKASEYYGLAGLKSSSIDSIKKMAHIYGTNKDYKNAIICFEKVGKYMADNKSLTYNASEYYIKALICHIAQKSEDINEYIERYESIDTHLENKSTFIKDIVECNEDVNKFSKICAKNDINDPWIIQILLRIKNDMKKIDNK